MWVIFLKVLYSKDVSVCIVPQIKGLRSNDILAYFLRECNGKQHLPHNYFDRIQNRTWMANMCLALLFHLLHRKFDWYKWIPRICDFKAGRAKGENLGKATLRNGHRWKYWQNIFRIADGVRYATNLLCMFVVAKGRSNHLLRKAITRK